MVAAQVNVSLLFCSPQITASWLVEVNWMQMRGTGGISTHSPRHISLAVGFCMIEFHEIHNKVHIPCRLLALGPPAGRSKIRQRTETNINQLFQQTKTTEYTKRLEQLPFHCHIVKLCARRITMSQEIEKDKERNRAKKTKTARHRRVFW